MHGLSERNDRVTSLFSIMHAPGLLGRVVAFALDQDYAGIPPCPTLKSDGGISPYFKSRIFEEQDAGCEEEARCWSAAVRRTAHSVQSGNLHYDRAAFPFGELSVGELSVHPMNRPPIQPIKPDN